MVHLSFDGSFDVFQVVRANVQTRKPLSKRGLAEVPNAQILVRGGLTERIGCVQPIGCHLETYRCVA